MSKSTAKKRTILAAGGVLWSAGPGERTLALVHRTKHADWALPKGKLKRGETFERAALREVREETGCDATLGLYAGLVSYTVRGTVKVVLFWNMDLRRARRIRPNAEIAEVLWLKPEKALRLMSHPLERKIVRRALRMLA